MRALAKLKLTLPPAGRLLPLLYAELDIWILDLSYTADFLKETLSLGLIFWQSLLATSPFYAKHFPLCSLLLCSTVRLCLLYGDGVQPHPDSHPDLLP